MKRASALLVLIAGCASAADIPPAETPYFKEQLAIARAAATARPTGDEAAAIRDATSQLQVRGAAESARILRGDETEGLLDVETPAAREFLAKLADATADDVLAATPLDVERALLAVYARNPDVAAARADWSAAVRMYDQAMYLEDVMMRTGASSLAASRMMSAGVPRPSLAPLKAEMLDREVDVARETTRMRLRDALVATSRAWHAAVHQREELAVRDEALSLAKRAAEATRAQASSGKSPQAELLEMEAEAAEAANARVRAESAAARGVAELNTLLGRDPQARLVLAAHVHEVPPADESPVGPLLALTRRFSPEVRMARAMESRAAAAVRLAEATLVGATGAPEFAGDAAWIEELRARRVAMARAAEEAVGAAERRVLAARDEMEMQRRMYRVAAKDVEPLAAQAAAERLRLYESGRGEFAELAAALRRRLDAAHEAVEAKHEYFLAEADLWMSLGARPALVGGGEKR